jgi:hypothetical protein
MHSHLPALGCKCITQRQELRCFPHTNQVPLHKNNKNQLAFLMAVPAGSQDVPVAFKFISEHTAQGVGVVAMLVTFLHTQVLNKI